MKKKFTIIELLVVIAVIGILTALIMPAYSLIRERSRTGYCINNLKQIGLCLHQYTVDYKDTLPVCERLTEFYLDNPTLTSVLKRYASGNIGIFRCPSDLTDYQKYNTSYEWNSFISGQRIDNCVITVGTIQIVNPPLCGDANNYHRSGKNYLYADAHDDNSTKVTIKTSY
mgnify:CR=1 FL=1